MAFVKLDCDMLNSTTWYDRPAREIFITALLMAEPFEVREPMAQIEVRSLDKTGWLVPPGWYGFVPAAGPGIVHRACLDDLEAGLEALVRLGRPEPESRSHEFDGRRLVRVDRGFIVLNYFKFRERDHTTAERSKRWREKKKADAASRRDVTPESVRDTPAVSNERDTTQAEDRRQISDPDHTPSPAVARDPDLEPRARALQQASQPTPEPEQPRAGPRAPMANLSVGVDGRPGWLSRSLERPRTPGAAPEPRQDPLGERLGIGQWAPSQFLLDWCREQRLPDRDFDAALIELRDKVTGLHDVGFWDLKAVRFLEQAIARKATPPGVLRHRANGGRDDAPRDAPQMADDAKAKLDAILGRPSS